MMAIVWVVMNNLGEIATYLPLKGITIPYFVNRFVDPSLAFAAGWNYWYAFTILTATEATAGAIIIDYWQTPVPVAVWITIILVINLLLNVIVVSAFGEAEFWFASIKLITILGLILVGLVIMLGGAPTHDRLGFRYWSDPGAFRPYIIDGSVGYFLAYWTAFIRAGFAFVMSPELIAVAAGETEAPRRNIPKAVKRFVARLALFYGVSSLILGCIVPWKDPRLLSSEANANASPWVIGIQRAGIGGLNHAINGAILTSAWSAGNAFLYSGSRVLYSMALAKQAPAIFTRTSRNGLPYAAVLCTWCFSLLAFLNVSSSSVRVFTWFANLTTISGFLAWIVIMITYLRFRSAMEHGGLLHTLPFRTPLQPYVTWFALGVLSLLTLTNGFQVFLPSIWDVKDFLAAYITLPVFLVLYLGHKWWFKTPFCRKLDDVDVVSGKQEMDDLCACTVDPVARNWLGRIWFWVA
jgi:amino acid transporter